MPDFWKVLGNSVENNAAAPLHHLLTIFYELWHETQFNISYMQVKYFCKYQINDHEALWQIGEKRQIKRN